jgi:CIC family chloride channel protein
LIACTSWILVICIRLGIHTINDIIFGLFDESHHTFSYDNVRLGFILIFGTLLGSAVVRGLLLKIPSWHGSEGDGLDMAVQDYHSSYGITEQEASEISRYKKSTFLQAIKRSLLTTLTIGGGGSGGIEAPVIPIGECLGAGWSRIFKVVNTDDLRIFQMAGMSAAVTTILDAPLAAALLAAEVVYNAKILYRPLMYSLIGSVAAFALNNYFSVFEPLFMPAPLDHVYSIGEYLEISAVAMVCSFLASIGITYLFKGIEFIMTPFSQIFRFIIGAIGIGIIGLITWYGLGLAPNYVLGISEQTIIKVMQGENNVLLSSYYVLTALVVLKSLATGFTLVAGGSAGRLVPAMYIGGLSGAVIYYLLSDTIGLETNANVDVFLVAGLASGLVAIRQIPLAAMALVMEVFGTNYLPPAIVSCVLTYLLARRWQLYTNPTK